MDVRLPDGTILRGVPDGTSRAELTEKLARNGYDVSKLGEVQDPKAAFQSKVDAQRAADKEKYAPTVGMSGLDKFAAGFGKAMTDTARGVGQFVGAVSRDDVAESRRLDAPLMDTGAGMGGNFAGNAAMLAPTALIPGAATIRGASMIGAGAGLAQPSTSMQETLLNTGVGAAAGAGGQWLGNKVPGWVRGYGQSAKAKSDAAASAAAQKFKAASDGSSLGYVVPPADLNPGMVSEAASGLSGKIKTAQVASQRNQGVTDKLARRALGLADDATLDAGTLQQIRNQAGQQYQAVGNAGQVQAGKAYTDAIDDAIKPFTSQSRSFPNRKLPAVVDDINSLKSAQFDAGDAIEQIKILRNDADKAYAGGDKLAGKAYKAAAEAIENAIDGHLARSGAPGLDAFRQARQLIAKTYTVQKALNPETGTVSAQVLARELAKGKPLSGELKQAAQFATAFPKAAQALKEAPKQLSPLDMAVAFTSAAGTGNPGMLAMLAARPATRAALLSGPAQRAALNPGFKPSMTSRALPALLDNDLLRIGAAPLSISGGLLGANPGQ
jgi:hypothetical protein